MFINIWNRLFATLRRKKPLNDSSESKLAKVLTTFDLTALGIGSTLGVGVYVLAGEVSKTLAGPAVILSFLIAAIASVFAGLCYAEFGARVPKAGSAYIYSYVTIGEFIAFIIGWNLILEYMIGSASVVKGLSTYLDKLFGYAMRDYLTEHLPMNVDGLGEFPDLFAFIATMLFSIGIAIGAKESTIVNNIFTILNLCVVLFVIIAGLFKVDSDNWKISEEKVPPTYGTGGFFPYGFAGVIKGAAVCFYGFIGFDCIATAGEEAKNPRKSIPISVILSLTVIFLAYFGVSVVLTMMLPYFEQDENAPLPHVFEQLNWIWAKYIVSVGAIFGLCASLMGAMFPLPRIVFAMASDGLLFSFMGAINSRFKTPLNGTLLTGFITGVLAAIFNLSQLVKMMSIGTLLAYSMVSACVMILRYEYTYDKNQQHNLKPVNKSTIKQIFRQLFNKDKLKFPSQLSSQITTWSVTLYALWCFFLAGVVTLFEDDIQNIEIYHYILLILAIVLLIITLVIIWLQPVSEVDLSFKVPCVPVLPGLSILINSYLMVKLDVLTWIRFAVWIVIGLAIYCTYGVRQSKERIKFKEISKDEASHDKNTNAIAQS